MTEKAESQTKQKLNQDGFVPGQLLSAQDIAKLEKARRDRERAKKKGKPAGSAQAKTDGAGDANAVGKKTYWKNSETGEVGVTEKGGVLPEGVETITKAQHDEAAKPKE